MYKFSSGPYVDRYDVLNKSLCSPGVSTIKTTLTIFISNVKFSVAKCFSKPSKQRFH